MRFSPLKHCSYVPILAVLYAKLEVISFAGLGRV